MNEVIAEYLLTKLSGETWVDKIAGVVKPFVRIDFIFDEELETSIPVRHIYPVSCKLSYEACSSSAYSDLMPNSAFHSVAYFEDNGSSIRENKKGNTYFKSSIRFICWLNMQLFEHSGCTLSDKVIPRVVSLFRINSPINYGGLIELSTNVVGITKKDAAIFGQYTYNEEISQYLLYPYDYFAIDIEAQYGIAPIDCYDELIRKEIC